MTRLRQIVLTSRLRDPVAAQLETELGFSEGFNDPGVGAFGLENVVYATGDTFVEIVSPVEDNTAAGRTIDRHGEGGYMAIFQVADIKAARERVADLGIRVVWHAELEDIAAMHLHPKDIAGAIVSIDQPEPPQSWRWGGPTWIGAEVPAVPGGVRAITVHVPDATSVAATWAGVLGETTQPTDDGALLVLDGGVQRVRFTELADGQREGIDDFVIAVPGAASREVTISGVRFEILGI